MIALTDVAPVLEVTQEFMTAINVATGGIDVDRAMIAASQCVKRVAEKNLYDMFVPQVEELYEMHVMERGENPEKPTFLAEQWFEPLEAKFIELADNYGDVVSANWLVTCDNLVPRKADQIDKAGKSFATEVYRNITYIHDNDDPREKTAAQILSAVGLVRADIEVLLSQRNTNKEVTTMQYVLKDVIETMNEMAEMSAMTEKDIANHLDNATDTDFTLAAGGLSAFGLSVDQASHYIMQDIKRRYGLEHFVTMVHLNAPAPHQDAPPEEVRQDDPSVPGAPKMPEFGDRTFFDGKEAEFDGLNWQWVVDAPTTTVVPPGTITMGDAPETPANKPRGAKRGKAEPSIAANVIPTQVLKLLKDHTALKGEQFAEGLMIARPTFDAYSKGKGNPLIASVQNIAFLNSVVETHKAALEEAGAMLAAIIPQ